MTLKVRLRIYLVAIHAVAAALLIWQRAALGWWLFALEVALVLSFLLGLRLVHSALAPLEIARTLSDLIESGEHGARYPRVGQPDVDAVIDAYNRMLSNLQQEWLRVGEQRGFLERFLQVTPVGVVIFDFDDRVSLANARARELLYESGGRDPTGRRLGELDSAVAAFAAGLAVDDVRMLTDAAGRRLRCQKGEFHDRGFARSYVLIEELTEELNRSERATYEKLIRMISHEVTNTVAATNSLLESCLKYADRIESTEHRDDYANALGVLIARNRSLNEFTLGFTDLVKLPEPQLQEVRLDEMVMALRTMFAAELGRRGIALEVRMAEDLPRVRADRGQLDQVMINVTKNAMEAIERDGCIEIVASRNGAYVEVSVVDDGPGLDEQSKASLFTPFYTSKGQGQGIGLTLVKEILTQHGFGFSLDTAAGKTRFQIRMPV